MITRIETYDYRCFPRLGIDLGRYHVLAGANGAGKTTLLDIPVLLGDLLRNTTVADAFLLRQQTRDGHGPRAHTLRDLPYRGRGETIAFAVEARLPESVTVELASASGGVPPVIVPTHLRYELRLEVSPRHLEVGDEYLFLFAERGSRPEPGKFPQGERPRNDWQVVLHRQGRGRTFFTPEIAIDSSDLPPLRIAPDRLGLSGLPADETLFPAASWLTRLLLEGVVFFDPDWRLLRRAARPGDPLTLLPSGRNTPWLVMALQESDPDRFASWVDHVRTALPQVAGITALEREEDHYAYLQVTYSSGHRVTSSSLSDGTLRILALTLLPYLPEEMMPRLLVTEEPENGIHPRAIETVVQSLSTLYDSQVWVSTHSPIVLAHTNLADVLAARLHDDGEVTVVPGNEHPRLRDWQGSLDIGTLFAAGVLS